MPHGQQIMMGLHQLHLKKSVINGSEYVVSSASDCQKNLFYRKKIQRMYAMIVRNQFKLIVCPSVPEHPMHAYCVCLRGEAGCRGTRRRIRCWWFMQALFREDLSFNIMGANLIDGILDNDT